MQKIGIPLPPGDLVDLWDFTLRIAKSICPSLRDAKGYAWIQKKLDATPGSGFETLSYTSQEERSLLVHLLPGLPLQAGMTKDDRNLFMDAYLCHPERAPWKPVFVTEEEVAANGFEILRIQEKHLLALQHEIRSGNIPAVDADHMAESRAGLNTFIRRDDALRYLTTHQLRVSEDHQTSPSTSIATGRGSDSKVDTAPRSPTFKGSKQNNALVSDVASSVLRPEKTESLTDEIAGEASEQYPVLPNKTRTSAKPQKIGESHQVNQNREAAAQTLGAHRATVILRRRQVEARTSLSRSAIYDRLDPNSPRYDATFPRQVKLGNSSVGWLESEVEMWLATRTRPSR